MIQKIKIFLKTYFLYPGLPVPFLLLQYYCLLITGTVVLKIFTLSSSAVHTVHQNLLALLRTWIRSWVRISQDANAKHPKRAGFTVSYCTHSQDRKNVGETYSYCELKEHTVAADIAVKTFLLYLGNKLLHFWRIFPMVGERGGCSVHC